MMAGHINHVLKVANSFVMMNLCYSKPYHGGRTVLTRSLIKALAVLSLLDALIQLLGRIRSSLLQHFSSGGEITRVSSPKDYETGASKGEEDHFR